MEYFELERKAADMRRTIERFKRELEELEKLRRQIRGKI